MNNVETTALTNKQRTEREYYNSIVHNKWDGKSLKIDAAQPPFANYSGDLWDAARRYFGDVAGKKILEIGCGNGELAVWFALNGAQVSGVDISDESITVCQRRSAENGTTDRTHFWAGPGEKIPFPDQTFDLVFIAVSLHHLIVEDALKEIRRVLKPSGWFVAMEPFVFSRTVQRVRNSRLVQKLYPERRETPTERILYASDLQTMQQDFTDLEYRPYRIISPFVFKFKPLFNFLANTFYRFEPDPERRRQRSNRANQRFDERLLSALPFLRSFSRYIVWRCRPKVG